MKARIYTIVVTDYIEHNLGTIKKVSVPYATSDMQKAKELFDSILCEKLEELEYEFSECNFDKDFSEVTDFKMREVIDYVEDDWFDIVIKTTELI